MPRLAKTVAFLAAVACIPIWIASAQDPRPTEESARTVAAKAAKGADLVSPRIVEKIKEEGSAKSEVMKTLDYLTNVIGPRLTASPAMKRANTWTRDKLYDWGLKDAHLEAWGPFGRGWTLKKFSAQIVEPQCIPLIAVPRAWSRGLEKPVVGDVVLFEAKNDKELEQYKGKLKDAIVIEAPPRPVQPRYTSQGARLTDKELIELADSPEPQPRAARRGMMGGRPRAAAGGESATIDFLRKKNQFLIDEGVAVLAGPSGIGDGGTIFAAQANVPRLPNSPSGRINPWDKTIPPTIPQIVIAVENYNRLVRMIRQGEKLKMAVDFTVQFHDDDLMGYNTVAEIPGTDLKDEIVMVGGHMDSWHTGTGATDNAAGVASGMEAIRIIQALGLKPRRTIRIGLWSGEEQGLFGSKAYVDEHFGKFEDVPQAVTSYHVLFGGEAPTPKLNTTGAYEKLSVYYNLDNGTGKIRGVYLEGNEAARPIFRRWLEPFREMGASTLSISRTGGTDHMSFDAIGLPGFQFIQDPIEYDTRTHHSNMDVYERLEPEDLKQASTIIAWFLYNSAMRDELIPRKPMGR